MAARGECRVKKGFLRRKMAKVGIKDSVVLSLTVVSVFTCHLGFEREEP